MSEPARLTTGLKAVEEAHRFDEAKLAQFLERHLDDFDGSLEVRQFRGGQSNPTYCVSDGTREWVLRRKPPGQLLASAHAVDREFRILSALAKTDVPVPRARVLCEDESVIGTMFYVMDRVEGRVFPDPTLPDLEPAERRAVYESLIDTLALLHAVDYRAIGLEDYGKPGNYFARQIHRWGKQYRAAETETIEAMDRLIEWLPGHIPEDDATSIAHGDYGLNNVLVDPSEPRLVAILDWELSTIGHPLADLTYTLSHRLSPTGGFAELDDEALRASGIPSESEVIARYCERTGRDGIDDLDFYLAFHLFRSASIMQGIASRVKTGTAAGEGAEEIGRLARPLAEAGLERAAKLGA